MSASIRLVRIVLACSAACALLLTGLGSAARASGLSFASPVVVGGTGDSEPGIVVAPDGRLYIDAPDGLLANGTSPSGVFVSADGGRTWVQTPPGLRSDFPGGGDVDLAIDPSNGALYLVDLWLGDSTASVSTDGGQSWLAEPLGGPPVQDRPFLATTGNGVVYEAVHQVPTGIVVSKSVGGLVYAPVGVAATVADQTGCVCPSGNVVAEPGIGPLGTSDEVGVIYADSVGGIKFARSTDGGVQFETAVVAPDGSGATSANFPVVADAGGGHLAAVWLDEGPTADSVELATSSDFGATWSTPQTIVSGGTSVYPWVAASGDTIAVSLYHTSAVAPTPDTVPSDAAWYESALESTDGGASWSPLVTADPTPAKIGPVCTAGAACSANRQLGDFQSLALDGSKLDLAYVRVNQAGVGVLMFVQGS